jgi:hypothetical protein
VTVSRTTTPEQLRRIAHQIMAHLGLQIIYVFSGMVCNDVRYLKVAHRTMDTQRLATGGSGTPYALVRKEDQRPLDTIFGSRIGGPIMTTSATP